MTAIAAYPEPSTRATERRIAPALRFVGHYLEMVAVMLIGMTVLGGAALGLLALAGVTPDELAGGAPAVVLIGMAMSMVAPMVWWMHRRGHSAAANREMAGAMTVPSLATIALLAAGVVTDMGALLELQHVAMFPAMFGVMLFRRDEYTHRLREDPR
jgi:hypothetical protein